MPPPVADQSKVQKRKNEMGHGSLHGKATDGYGKSPIVTKPKLPGAVDLVDLDYTLSPGRVGSKRRSANTRHPHSAPTRSKKLSAAPNGFPTVPDLFDNDNTGANTKAKSAKNLGTSPIPERSTRKFHNSMPLGMVIAPDLDMDSSVDSDSFNPPSRIEILTRSSSAGYEPESFHLSSISTANFLDCIPEKKVKKNAKSKNTKELVTKDTSLATSSSSDKNGSPPEKTRRSTSASPGRNKEKYWKRSSAPVASDTNPPASPTRTGVRNSTSAVPSPTGKKTMVVKPSRSVSMSAANQPINSNSTRGSSPDKRASNYRRGDSDLTHNRGARIHSPEREGLVLSSSHSRSEDGVAKRSTKQIKAMQAPLTWQNDRDSRKLNSSNFKEKIGRLAPMPVLDDSVPPVSQSQRRSQRQPNSFGLSSSYQSNPGLDSSLRSSGHGSSHKRSSSQPPRSENGMRVSQSTNVPRTSDHDKRISQSSHVSRSMGPRNSAHQRMSQSAHARSSVATTSKDAVDSQTNPRRSMQTSAHKAGGVVGSVVTLVDKVLENTTQLPANKYGVSEKEKATMLVEDESVGASFADEDIEARGAKNSKENDPKKSSPETATFHVPKIMEMTLGIEKRPPMTLVIVWMLIVTELTFDFVTTVISFKAFTSAVPCCGYEMNLGILPMAMTVPFFCLVMAESVFLFIGITMTLWPSIVNVDLEGRATSVKLLRPLLCCFKWNATAVLYALNVTVILNPFFGCVIAWMLMYQSNKAQSFLVLGLEGASIVLHFTCVWLEGHCKSCKTFCFHCVQLIPFLTSVTLILLYLRQGGICYIVSEEKFAFTGCEICPNGLPPIDGMCQLPDGTNMTLETLRVWEVQGDFNDLANALTARSVQATYCAANNPNGPDENFCFYTY